MKLTKNFNSEEFDCNDGTKVPFEFMPNLIELAKNLQALRDFLNEPVLITGSGYRTPTHNKKVGGAVNSQHLTASAADINVKSKTPYQLGKLIENLINKGIMKQGGIGIYKGFVHYDIRNSKARW
jgi:uncharacterized protein YcbK (DUF882 family)